MLEAAGLAGSIGAIVTSDDVVDGKPHPEGYLRALEELGVGPVGPGEAVAFEDTEAGVASAKAAGFRCLAVLGTLDPHRLAAADEIVPAIDVPLVERVLVLVKIAAVDVFGYELPLPARELRHVRRPLDRRAAEHGRPHPDGRGHRGLRRDLPARPRLSARVRRGGAGGAARARPGARRPRPLQPRARQRDDGPRAARPRVREERRRRRLLGRARQGDGAAGRDAPRRAPPGELSALRRDPARAGRGDGRARARAHRRGHPPLPAQARRRPARGRRVAWRRSSRRPATTRS